MSLHVKPGRQRTAGKRAETTANMAPPDLRALFQAQHDASRACIEPSYEVRRDRLLRIEKIITANDASLKAAMAKDFGIRGELLSEAADFFVLRATLAHNLKHLKAWMRPRRVPTPLFLRPASGYVQHQPLGCVGIIAPWNYPVQLALAPAVVAMAAGNRVLIKPSELSPATSQCLHELVSKYFRPDELAVVQGGSELASQFAALPFDHLVFTGSTSVGRKVAEVAAVNLTPLTLELGGKSPTIIDASADLQDAAIKIAHGKLLNAGQTCIAPDYVFVPRGSEREFAAAFDAAAQRMYPRMAGNGDYPGIISERHLARLNALVADAQAKGATVQAVGPRASAPAGSQAASGRQFAPLLVFDVTAEMTLMQEEIFGPVLPVMAYDSLAQVIEFINARPRPLALYWFGKDAALQAQVLSSTVSGGVTINDTLMHIAHEHLPFGGVGDSGSGNYHGEAGWLRFTHAKAVLVQSRFSAGQLFYPPYAKRFTAAMGLVKRML